MEGSGPGGEESLSSSSCGTTASLNEDTPISVSNSQDTPSTTGCPPTPPPPAESTREKVTSGSMEKLNQQPQTNDSTKLNGHTNPGFEDDSKTSPNGKELNSSLALGEIPSSKTDETDTCPVMGLEKQHMAEAVNLELVNMKPYGEKRPEEEDSGIPEKKQGCVGIEMGNTYPEAYDQYFVPVNEHKKYMRGEKLYVTRDQRKSKGCGRKLCWITGVALLAAAVIIAILAATGVILTQEEPILKESAESSGRAFGEPQTGSALDRNGGEQSVEMSSRTPPPSSTTINLKPTTDMSFMYVPRTLDAELTIDNMEFSDALLDSNSTEYQELANTLEEELKAVLFDYQTLNYGSWDINIKVQGFSAGSIQVKYRIGWTIKDGIKNPRDPIDVDKVRKAIEQHLRNNAGMIYTYAIRPGSVRAMKLLNSCELNHNGCSHDCTYNYKESLQFECHCPEGMGMDESGKNCINQEILTSSSTSTTSPTPEPTPEPTTINHYHHESSSELDLPVSTSSTSSSTTTTTTELPIDEIPDMNYDEPEDESIFPIVDVVTELHTTTTTTLSPIPDVTESHISQEHSENAFEGRHFANIDYISSTTTTHEPFNVHNETNSLGNEQLIDIRKIVESAAAEQTTTTSTTTTSEDIMIFNDTDSEQNYHLFDIRGDFDSPVEENDHSTTTTTTSEPVIVYNDTDSEQNHNLFDIRGNFNLPAEENNHTTIITSESGIVHNDTFSEQNFNLFDISENVNLTAEEKDHTTITTTSEPVIVHNDTDSNRNEHIIDIKGNFDFPTQENEKLTTTTTTTTTIKPENMDVSREISHHENLADNENTSEQSEEGNIMHLNESEEDSTLHNEMETTPHFLETKNLNEFEFKHSDNSNIEMLAEEHVTTVPESSVEETTVHQNMRGNIKMENVDDMFATSATDKLNEKDINQPTTNLPHMEGMTDMELIGHVEELEMGTKKSIDHVVEPKVIDKELIDHEEHEVGIKGLIDPDVDHEVADKKSIDNDIEITTNETDKSTHEDMITDHEISSIMTERDREETTPQISTKKPSLEFDQKSEFNPIDSGTTEGVYFTTTDMNSIDGKDNEGMTTVISTSFVEKEILPETSTTEKHESTTATSTTTTENNNIINATEDDSNNQKNETNNDISTKVNDVENDTTISNDGEQQQQTETSYSITTLAPFENKLENTEEDISVNIENKQTEKNNELTTDIPEIATIEAIMHIPSKNEDNNTQNEINITTVHEDMMPETTTDIKEQITTTQRINQSIQKQSNEEIEEGFKHSQTTTPTTLNVNEITETNVLMENLEKINSSLNENISTTVESEEDTTLPVQTTSTSLDNLILVDSSKLNETSSEKVDAFQITTTPKQDGIFEIDPFTGDLYRKSTTIEMTTESLMKEEKLDKKKESSLEKKMNNKKANKIDLSYVQNEKPGEIIENNLTTTTTSEASTSTRTTTTARSTEGGITGQSIEIVTEMSPEKIAEFAEKINSNEHNNVTNDNENDIRSFSNDHGFDEDDEPNNIDHDEEEHLKPKFYSVKEFTSTTEHMSSSSHISSEIEHITTSSTTSTTEDSKPEIVHITSTENVSVLTTEQNASIAYSNMTSETASSTTEPISNNYTDSIVNFTATTANDISEQVNNFTQNDQGIEHITTQRMYDSSMEILEATSTEHIALQICPAETWECLDKSKCIPLSKKCDTINDCKDGSDEVDCLAPTTTTTTTEAVPTTCVDKFQCKGANAQCLSRHLVCNGIADCPDGGDEQNCDEWVCSENEIKCSNGPCIPTSWRCDGKGDCADQMDEINCNTTCRDDQFHCSEDRCIPLSWHCDGSRDCLHGEDEVSCRCGENEWKCSTGGGCINITQRCDGTAQCADFSDEWLCISLSEDNNRLLIRSGNQTWHPVCADDWNSEWSRTACQALGYGHSLAETHIPLIGADTTFAYALTSPLALEEGTPAPPSPVSDLITSLAPINTTCQEALELTCDEFMCGSQEVSDAVAGRFVGGNRATTGQWPWVALLLHASDNSSCTGSIISPKWILASYSCLYSSGEGLNPRSWALIGGGALGGAGDAQIREVRKIVAYPQVKYANFLYTHDVALLELIQPLQFNRYVGAICLPESEIEPRELCVTAGWSRPPGEPGLQQYYLPVPTIDRSECNSTRHYPGFISGHQICAGYTDAEKSPCYRDEGAPLMCVTEGNVWELQGVLSYHSNCGKSFHPSIYTSVPPLKEWIKNTVGGSFHPKAHYNVR